MSFEALWPYLLVILAGFLPTEIWRAAAVVLAHGLDEDSEWLIFVRAVATALVAGVITRIVLVPTGDLVAVPLAIRVGAVAIGFVVFFVARRSMLLGVLAGEAVMIAGAWLTEAR
ncbi:MAG TPA: AzlD domain-containing protein [Xanthobacteraceae bacterium]|nr:AzlD domain-containing protein [Xanthobacteraceae bacterium]